MATIFNEYFVTIATQFGPITTINNQPVSHIEAKYAQHESIKQIKDRFRNSKNFDFGNYSFSNITPNLVRTKLENLNIKMYPAYHVQDF